jgi:superfamily II DNA or RNA helicase
LAEALAENRLAQGATSPADAVGLLEAQAEAFRACLSPGVRLVWGPPGTGKTQVLARAIEELARSLPDYSPSCGVEEIGNS